MILTRTSSRIWWSSFLVEKRWGYLLRFIFTSKMKDLIILQGFTKEELFQHIETVIENSLTAKLTRFIDELSKVKKVDYITRKQAAALLRISLPTLSSWTKLGIVTSVKIGTRVLYRSDILESCTADLQKGTMKKYSRR